MPYLDLQGDLGLSLKKDGKKYTHCRCAARLIVMSLTPESGGIISLLESLIQTVETFCHPSNTGAWTKPLFHLFYFLADTFVMRWNREKSGEMSTPPGRKLDLQIKKRFVAALVEVIFMGIYSRSQTASSYAQSALQALAYLEPKLILPEALKRIYPSMQGHLLEVHRTASSFRSLCGLSSTIASTKVHRNHITALLGLALQGIDPNDLGKAQQSLAFLSITAYNISFCDQSDGLGTELAMQWVSGEVTRMENVLDEYGQDESVLDEEQDIAILKSSTGGFADFIVAFLGKFFTLLENLPDTGKVKVKGAAEESIVSMIPSAFTAIFSSLSPELFDLALNKVADFVSGHVVHQACDATAHICNALGRVNAKKTLSRMLPIVIGNIRNEVEENGASTSRYVGSEVLPRDRALIWNLSILSMLVVYVGEEVMFDHQQIEELAIYMQERLKGIGSLHVANFLHHLLLNLTSIYPLDVRPLAYEEGSSLRPDAWACYPDPQKLQFQWHTPSSQEVAFAVRIFETHTRMAYDGIKKLLELDKGSREAMGNQWSDEMARNINYLRTCLAGVASLFDVSKVESCNPFHMEKRLLDEYEMKYSRFQYPTGYYFMERKDDPLYEQVHEIRQHIGRTIHTVHQFLSQNKEDDISCFRALTGAIRSYFLDVGTEKTARALDRNLRVYSGEIRFFRINGLRKHYPRPLLIKRAYLYHLQRLRFNAGLRHLTVLDHTLMLDLANSSISSYESIRKNSQSVLDAGLKQFFGSRIILAGYVLELLEETAVGKDVNRIKGAVWTISTTSLSRTVTRDWRFAPAYVKALVKVSDVDQPSAQMAVRTAYVSLLSECRIPFSLAVYNKEVLEALSPAKDVKPDVDAMVAKVKKKRSLALERKASLSQDMIHVAETAHWRVAAMAGGVASTALLDVQDPPEEELVKLVTKGTIDSHPGLRAIYGGAFLGIIGLFLIQSMTNNDIRRLVEDEFVTPRSFQKTVEDERNEGWLAHFFQKMEPAHYVDVEYPGWLVWADEYPAYYSSDIKKDDLKFGAIPTKRMTTMGGLIDPTWIETLLRFMKQEPREGSQDHYRQSVAYLMSTVFFLLRQGKVKVQMTFIQKYILEMYGNGSDKNHHRATAECLGGLITASRNSDKAFENECWQFIMPIIKRAIDIDLNPENLPYWRGLIRHTYSKEDARRSWPLTEWLSSFRLDMKSNAAFKESSKISMLRKLVTESGWHFQLHEPILQDFIQHINHPYKGVREEIGRTLGAITSTRYHESFPNTGSLLKSNKIAGPMGVRPYQSSPATEEMMKSLSSRLAQWRLERTPGQEAPSDYTSGAKTVLLWFDTWLSSASCTQMLPFFPDMILPELLHMLDVKEDPELLTLALQVLRHMANVPHMSNDIQKFLDALHSIAASSTSWHQRGRILSLMQIFFFRNLFVMTYEQRQRMLAIVGMMLSDSQLEVRENSGTTLAGMIRCLPASDRDAVVAKMKKQYNALLDENKLTCRIPNSTPTPNYNRMVIQRHAAVLGLSALVQAYPYASPPPRWLPYVLATLANKAAGDPGMVGKSVKAVLGNFKKTRIDTWHVDVKIFSPEELEDLEGVLVRNYFA